MFTELDHGAPNLEPFDPLAGTTPQRDEELLQPAETTRKPFSFSFDNFVHVSQNGQKLVSHGTTSPAPDQIQELPRNSLFGGFGARPVVPVVADSPPSPAPGFFGPGPVVPVGTAVPFQAHPTPTPSIFGPPAPPVVHPPMPIEDHPVVHPALGSPAPGFHGPQHVVPIVAVPAVPHVPVHLPWYTSSGAETEPYFIVGLWTRPCPLHCSDALRIEQAHVCLSADSKIQRTSA